MPAINIADLSNAKADVDHIAAIATSPAPTATDRLGQTKKTLAGLADDVQSQAAIAAAAAFNDAAALVLTANDAALYPFVPSKQRVVNLVAGSYQRAISSIANPDTRYAISISSASLQVDISQVTTLIAGVRLGSISRVPGRTYAVQGAFDAGGTALGSNSGIGLAFDPGTSSGANMLWDAAASGWFWRQNGSITAYALLPSGATVDASIPFTLPSGPVPAFVAGDVLRLELVESTNGTDSTLRGYKNGALAFSGTVANVPAGRLATVVRGIGGGGAYPAAQRFTFTSVSIQDKAVPDVAVPGASATVATNPVALAMESSSRLGALNKLKPDATVKSDFNGLLKRVAPPGFEWLPIVPLIVPGPGHVVADKTMVMALMQAYPAVLAGTIAYVESGGNNATAVIGNSAKPYLTLDAALQSTARIILVGDGTFTPPDYRFTQAVAGAMKLIVAKNRGKVTLRNPGDALSANTWTATPGYAGVYETPIASAAAGGTWAAFRPHRVRLTDTLDSEGFQARLRWYKPAADTTAAVTTVLAALQAAGTGWTYDGTLKKLYVALGGANVNTVKSRLEALYCNASGTDRVYISGANLAFDGIDLDGQVVWMQEYNNAGTYIPASVWASNARLINSTSYGVQGDSNTMAILENVHIHASEADGINPDSTRNGSGAVAKALLINPRITDCGDVDTFGTGVSSNRQAISSHSGYFAAYGGAYEHNWGQEIADTGSGAGPSKSWYVAPVARNGDTRLAQNVGFGFYDPNRVVWIDTAVAVGEGTNPLRIEGGASVKLFNCQFDGPAVVVAPSVAPTAYTPGAP